MQLQLDAFRFTSVGNKHDGHVDGKTRCDFTELEHQANSVFLN